MTATTIRQFDILEFVKMAEENGITRQFAEYMARQIDQLSKRVKENRIKIDMLKRGIL